MATDPAPGSDEEEQAAGVVYALIDGRWISDETEETTTPGRGDVDDDGGEGAPPLPPPRRRHSVPLPSERPAGGTTTTADDDVGGAVVSLTSAADWHDHFSRMSPSRAHLERRRRRREIEEEGRRRRASEGGRREGGGGGWLLRLFFGWGWGSADEDDEEEEEEEEDDDDASEGDGEDPDDARSIGPTSEADDRPPRRIGGASRDGMCGASSPLDAGAALREASAFHRFHLASERRAMCRPARGGWNVVLPVRRCAGGEGDDGDRLVCCIVGYGRIAEFPSLDAAETRTDVDEDVGGAARVSLTSDYRHLLSVADQREHDADATPHDLRHCRAASVGRDCLAVSWGRGDGWVVFYRRAPGRRGRRRPRRRGGRRDEEATEVGWDVVAVASPSGPVLHVAMQSVTPDPRRPGSDGEEDAAARERRLHDSGSLFVTDLVPVAIDDDDGDGRASNERRAPKVPVPSSAVLAISRLGGYVELLPLPSWMRRPGASPPPPQDFLPNLAAALGSAAFSTTRHHLDVTAMDAYRTDVGPDAEWDEGRRPDGPPAELVLAVCGRPSGAEAGGEGGEDPTTTTAADRGACVTLWGIAAVHAFPKGRGDEPGIEPTFDLRVRLVGRADLENVGADASSFLSDAAAERWSGDYDDDGPRRHGRAGRKRNFEPPARRGGVVTVPAPVSSLRFAPAPARRGRVLLAALDYNGGVSVLDCAEAVRSAEHATGESREGAVVADGDRLPEVRLACDRATTMSIPPGRRGEGWTALASQIEWWPRGGEGTDGPTLVSCAALAGRRPAFVRLQRWNFPGGKGPSAEDRPEDVFRAPIAVGAGAAASAALLLPPAGRASRDPDGTLTFLQLTAGRAGDDGRNELSVRGVRRFASPDGVVASLLRRGSPSRALDVARRSGGAERFGGRLMDECRVRLWEDGRDAGALRLVADDGYVVREALRLLDGRGDGGDATLNLEDIAGLLREALRRRGQGGTADDGAPPDDAASRLRDGLRRLGTFALLRSRFPRTTTTAGPADAGGAGTSSDPSAGRFLREFLRAPLVEVASGAAARGDVDALTAVLARHPVSLRARMRLLDGVPPETAVSEYEHLLPCVAGGDEEGDEEGDDSRRTFLTNGARFLTPPQMFAHLCDAQLRSRGGAAESGGASPSDVFTDDVDRDLVALHFWEGADDDDVDDPTDAAALKEEVAAWYLRRAIDLHDETGRIRTTEEILRAGLIRLGFVSFAIDGSRELSGLDVASERREGGGRRSAVGRLIYAYSATSLLCRILLDKLKEPLSSGRLPSAESSLGWSEDLFVSVIQFCSMDLSETVPFILESDGVARDGLSKFRKRVAHFVDGGECLEPTGASAAIASESLAGQLEHELMELCLERVKRLGKERKSCSSASSSLQVRLEESLSMCVDFATLGISNVERGIGLFDFAENVLHSVLDFVGGDWDLMTEEGVVGKLWSILELLPWGAVAPNGSAAREEGMTRSREGTRRTNPESLRFKLVVVQLCCQWRGRRAIPRELSNFLRSGYGGEGGKSKVCMAGHAVIAVVCGGFCDMVAPGNFGSDDGGTGFTTAASQQRDLDLLFDFVSDVDEFDKRYFSSGIQLSGCLGKYLFVPLLSQASFEVLKNILKIRSAWFCQLFLRAVIVSFVRDAAHREKVHVVAACQEILGPMFPGLAAELERQRRMLDARQFMAEAMKLEPTLMNQLFSNSDHSDNSLSLFRTLMATSPQVILLGCEFWGEELSALNASADASNYFTSQICASLKNGRGPAAEEKLSDGVLPPMPGALVMQLANVIGLHDPHHLLLVKRWMVNGALRMSLGPAAVAVCYSMLCDTLFSRKEHKTSCHVRTSQHELQHESIVIDTVLAIVGDKSFGICELKKELCTLALRLFSTTNVLLCYVLLDSFKNLEYQALALESERIESHDTEQAKQAGAVDHDFLVFKAAGLVARQARGIVSHSSAIPSVLQCGNNNFFDRAMSRVLKDVNQSSLVDLWELLSSMGGTSSLPNKSSLEAISKVVFNWVTTEAFKVRTASRSTSIPAANILMMMELGSSCMTELPGHCTASVIINHTLEDFKAKIQMSAASSQESSASLDYSIQPDISVVQKLNDRGYGWNAARRAVIMTKNRGYSVALTWAVTHFQDADFDSPIYILHADYSACADQQLIDMTGELLRSVQRNIEDNKRRAEQPSHDRNGTAKVLSNAVTPYLSKHSTSMAVPSKTASPSARPLPPLSPNVGDKRPVQPTPKNRSRAELSRPPNSAESISSVEGSLGSRASIKKQIQLGKTQLGTQKLSSEERKKLAMRGKLLLDAARAKNKRVIAPPTTITTSRCT